MDRPDTFLEALERLDEQEEAPVLSELQSDAIKSGYVNNYDEALQLLERSRRIRSDEL